MTEQAKVTTEHTEANDAIKCLREIAKTLKDVGDENVQLKEGNARLATLEGRVEELENAAAQDAEVVKECEEWRELLEDFRSGIRDRDELIERTVGRL